jgi:hypothetical protein
MAAQPAPPTPDEIARGLSTAMRRALRRRQADMLGADPIVSGHGMTMRALRQRGVIVGAMPHARLTEFGAGVVQAAAIDTMEGDADA